MKPGDKDKLNKCIKILESTDLGLSLVWLWTWDTMKSIADNGDYELLTDEDGMWEMLCLAVKDDHGFSLEYGAEQHYEDVLEWMLRKEILADIEEDEDEEEDEE
jgi:hypothetical protein